MACCWTARNEIPTGNNAMMSFLEYLKEYERQLKEDALMAAGTAANAGVEVASPGEAAASASEMKCADVTAHDAAPPMNDYSVLGGATSKKKCDKGFFGKGDFRIPKNVLSGEIETRKL